MTVAVFPTKYFASLDHQAVCPRHGTSDHGDCKDCTRAQVKRDPPWTPQGGLEDALDIQYDTDAHVSQYAISGSDQTPRLGVKSLPYLEENGMEVQMTCYFFDVDGPDHKAPQAWRDEQLRRIGGLGCPVSWYETNGGYRLVWRTETPLDLQTWAERRAILAHWLHTEHKIETDPRARGWHTLFRLPATEREGTPNLPGLRSGGLAQVPTAPRPKKPTTNPFDHIQQAKVPLSQIAHSGAPAGQRNATLTRMAGRWRRAGMTPEQVAVLLQDWNQRKCTPPLPNQEVEQIAQSASNWPAPQEKTHTPTADQTPLQSGSERELMTRIHQDLNTTPTNAPLIYAEGAVYRHQADHWEQVHPAYIRDQLGAMYEGFPIALSPDKDGNPRTKLVRISHRISKAVEQMLTDHLSHAPENQDWFQDAPTGVAFENGWVTPNHPEPQPHHWLNKNRYVLPHQYTPNTDPPKLFVDTLLKGCLRDHQDTQGAIQFLQEWFGVTLLGQATKFQTAIMLSGGGNNGKSTLLNIVGHLFQGRRSALTPQKMGDARYLHMLSSALINIITECPAAELMLSEEIKAAISGDEMTANPKHKQPFTFRPFCGHIFAANALPPVRDMSHGFFRRFKVIDFNRRFLEHEVDRDLERKIIEQEIDAVASWLVDGGLRAIRRGDLFIPEAVTLATKAWKSESSAVALWVQEQQGRIKHGQVTQLFERFKAWSAENNYRPMGRNTFSKRLATADGVEVKKSRNGTWVEFKAAVMEVAK